MREAEGLFQMIGEEEKSAQLIENLVKEQKIASVRDLKVKLGVAKEQDDESLKALQISPETQVESAVLVNKAVSVMAGDDEVEALDDIDDAL